MTTAPKRRWPRFSLRTLFVVVTVAGVAVGWLVYHLDWIRQRHKALEWLEVSKASWYAPCVTGGRFQSSAPLSIRLFGERAVVGIGMDREEFAGRVPYGPKELESLFPEARVGFSRDGTHEVAP